MGFGLALFLWRNCHLTLKRVLDLWRQGYNVVLDADIQGFFDNIPHLGLDRTGERGGGREYSRTSLRGSRFADDEPHRQ